jgi:DNA-binding NarL/FixJ family response regulator
LTPREREVLALLADGRRVRDIAGDLCISVKTASAHIEHILQKLGVHTQAQAVALALRDGPTQPRQVS